MAYSELIKSFERIRNYMREFYVYGFKSREEYTAKSARSYDNERRRIESWMGEYMSFRSDGAGKNVFLSVDSRRMGANPLHKAFKAKSFTDKDITLHFYILDILAEGEESFRGIIERIDRDYLSRFDTDFSMDESTVRKKLKEYETLGLIQSEKRGREVFYRRGDDGGIDLAAWEDALCFYSEADPMGVVGSFLLDKLAKPIRRFRFKHHYILHAMDSEILLSLLQGIDEKRAVEMDMHSRRRVGDYSRTVCPLKIYVSTQTGRQYLLGYHYQGRQMAFMRIDYINKVRLGAAEKNFSKYLSWAEKMDENLWGVSVGVGHNLDHIEMTLRYEKGEEYILSRLEREKRHGMVEVIDSTSCRFVADVYDAAEMLPWIRTFIGRISELKCSSAYVEQRFREDLRSMNEMYGGESDAVQ
ncbi:MAG: WYL domain-containing protein [Oscillospiraceae bacterium]|nr:WYL domain-containing protein [Oscillospiraceae bacterium]